MNGLAGEQLLQELSSRAAIIELGARYCAGVDRPDLDLFMSIWHPDGEYLVGRRRGRFAGTAELATALDFVSAAYASTHHWATNNVVELLDADRARASSDSFAICVDHAGRPSLVSAVYDDLYERIDGVWKIRRRAVHRRFVSAAMDLALDHPP